MCISYFRVHINVGYVTEGLVVVAMLACCSWGEPNTSKTSRVELPAFNNLILSFMMNKSYFPKRTRAKFAKERENHETDAARKMSQIRIFPFFCCFLRSFANFVFFCGLLRSFSLISLSVIQICHYPHQVKWIKSFLLNQEE